MENGQNAPSETSKISSQNSLDAATSGYQSPLDGGLDAYTLDADMSVRQPGAPQTEKHHPDVSHMYGNAVQAIPRRKALLISTLITLLVFFITIGSLYIFSNNSNDGGELSQGFTEQELDLDDDLKTPDIPGIEEGVDALLVNGDIVSRGVLKLSQSGFVAVIDGSNIEEDRLFSLPNESGTFCLDTNNCNYITPEQFTELQEQIGQIVVPPVPDGTSVNGFTNEVVIAGTANRVSVTSVNGLITLSTPQNIAPSSSPTFNNLTLNGNLGVNGTLQLNLNCSGLANGGALTTNASGQVICSDDDNSGGTGFVTTLNGLTGDVDIVDGGSSLISVNLNGQNVELSIVNDSIGNTQLAFNTGQHLTSTSSVTFDDLLLSDQFTVGGDTFDTLTGTGLQVVGNALQAVLGTSISLAELESNSVNSDKIVNGSVTGADIASETITGSNIQDGTITNADLGANSVNSGNIVDGSVTNTDLANSSLTITAGAGLGNGGLVSLGGSVALDINTGNGVAISSDAITLALQANKGLEVNGDGLSLIDCAAGQILKYNGSAQWACAADNYEPDTDTTYTAGNDLNLVGTTFNLDSVLNFVTDIIRDSGNLTLQTTTSGNIVLDSAGTIELLDEVNASSTVTVDGLITANGGVTLGASQQLTIGGDSFDDLTGAGLQVVGNALQAVLGTSVDSSEIVDGTIQAVDIESTNVAGAGTDNYVLTYDNATGGFTYVDPTSVGDADVDSINGLDGDLTIAGTAGEIDITPSGGDTFTFSLDAAVSLLGQTIELSELASNSVNSDKIVDGSVTNTDLANSSLTITAGAGLGNGGLVSLGGSVALDINTGNGVAISSDALTLALQANKGLEVNGDGLSLIDCAAGQILKYNGSAQWACAADDYEPDTDTTYTAGNDLNLVGTTFNLDSVLNFVTDIIRDSGNLTLQTTTSGNIVLDSAGTIELLDDTNIQGGLFLGADSSVTGALTFYNGTNSNTVSIQSGVTGGNYTLTLPTGVGSANQCLKAQNGTGTLFWDDCTGGAGGGLSGSGTNGRIARFTPDGTTLGDSSLTDDGTNATATGNFTVQGGGVTLGSASQTSSLVLNDGDGDTITLNLPNVTGSYTLTLPTGVGNANQCLKAQNGTGTLFWDDCTGGAGGGLGVESLNGLTGDVDIVDAGSSLISVNVNGQNIELSIQNDSIGDTQLAFDTGQHLTSTSSVTFDDLSLTDGLSIGGDTIDDFVGTGLQVVANVLQTTLGTSISLSELDSDSVNSDKIVDGSVTNTDLQNSSITVTAGSGLINGGLAALGGATTLDIGAGNGITVNADDITLALQTDKGLEVNGDGLSLIDCTNGQILKYNGTGQWVCAADAGGAGVGDDIQINGSDGDNDGFNFTDTTASATAAGITFNLNTATTPDEVTIAIAAASGTQAGIVTSNAQTFGGDKTFNGQIIAGSGINLGSQTLQGTTAVINFDNFDVDSSGNGDFAGTLAAGTDNAFQVAANGAVTAVGVNSGTGLIQGTGGLTVTGTTSVNATGTAATSIGNGSAGLTLTGTSISLNTAVLQRVAAGATTLNLSDASDTTFSIANLGGGNANLTVSGGATIQGAAILNGNTTLGNANTDTVSFASGSGNISFADAYFDSCDLLSTVSGVLTCAAAGSGGAANLQEAYEGGNTILATDAEGDIDLTVSEATNFSVDITGTGNFLVQDGGTTVLSVDATGDFLYQSSVDSVTGFQILDQDGGIPIFNVDTANERVGIGNAAPGATLDIQSAGGPALFSLTRTAVSPGDWDFLVTSDPVGGNTTDAGSLNIVGRTAGADFTIRAGDTGNPQFTLRDSGELRVTGDILSGNKLGFTNDVVTGLLSSGGLISNSSASSYINIDANNNSSIDAFEIAKDRTSSSGGTLLLRVQENGNVGIGSDSTPDALLSVGSSSQFQVNTSGRVLANVGAAGADNLGYSFVGDTDTGIYRSAADVLTIQTGGTDRVTVNATGTNLAGNLQVNGGDIGISSDTNLLQLAENSLTVNGVLTYTPGTAGTDTVVCRNGSGQLAGCNSTFATQSYVTLQNAYTNSSSPATITTADGKNIRFTLQDTATDQTVEISQAGTAAAFRVNDDGTYTDTTPFVIDADGNVGIATASPSARLDIGGYGSSVVAGGQTGIRLLQTVDAIGGLEFRNSSTGTSADTRFIAAASDNSYIGVFQPGVNNSSTLFGQTRSSASFVANSANGGANRNLVIGTVDATDVILGTSNTARGRVTAAGSFLFGSGNQFQVNSSGRVQANVGATGAGNLGYSFVGDTDTGIYASAADTLAIQTNGATRLTVSNTATTTTGNLVVTGNGTFQGGGLTVGTTSVQGNMVLHDGNGQTATIRIPNTLAADTVLSIPGTVGTSDTFCMLNLGNCFGSGTGNTLQAAYDADTDGSNVRIDLTVGDGSLIIADAGNSAEDYVLKIDQQGSGASRSGLIVTSNGGASGYAFRVNDDGTDGDSSPFIVSNSGNVGIGTTSTAGSRLRVVANNETAAVFNAGTITGAGEVVEIQGDLARGSTSSTYGSALYLTNNINPTAGQSNLSFIDINGTINQTVSATGITNGILIRPTLTSAVDYRAISLANNTGYGIYQAGSSAKNYFAGNVGIGNTTASSLLSVGSSEQFQVSSSGSVTVQNSTNSQTAFRILSQAGNKLLTADTTQNKIAFGPHTDGDIIGQVQITPDSAGARVNLTLRENSGNSGDFVQGLNAGGGEVRFRVDVLGGAVFNEAGFAGADFRVEGDNDANLLYTDATNDRIGIGTNAPQYKLHVVNNGNSFVSNDAYGGAAVFQGSRANGTSGAPSALGTSTTFAQFSGRGYGTSGFSSTRAAITLGTTQAWTDANQGSEIAFHTTANNTTTLTRHMTLSQNGNLGLGTASPTSVFGSQVKTFEVENAVEAAAVRIEAAATYAALLELAVTGATTDWHVQNTLGKFQVVETGIASRLTIDPGGNVGIGDSSPDYKFEVQGSSGNGYFGISSADLGTADVFAIDGSGVVKINTTSNPDNIGAGDEKLYVVGNTQFEGITRVGDDTNYAQFDANGQLRYTGNARNDRVLTLKPEFEGATFYGDGSNNTGYLNAGFCSNEGALSVLTTVCATSGDDHSYYEWTHSEGSAQDYNVAVRMQVPDNFDSAAAFSSHVAINVFGLRTDATNNAVEVTLYNDAGAVCGTANQQIAGTTWGSGTNLAGFGSDTDCDAIDAGEYITFLIRMNADTGGDTVRLGEIRFSYKSVF